MDNKMDEDYMENAMDSEESAAIKDTKEGEYNDPISGDIFNFVQGKYSKASTARESEESLSLIHI